MKCRISDKETLKLFSLGKIPMSDFVQKGETPRMGSRELELVFCEDSKLVQLSSKFEYSSMFGKYWYRSSINPTMVKHLKLLSEEIENNIVTKEGDVFLDIACNDGTLLSFVHDKMFKVGIDPADDSFYNESKKQANIIIQDYFSKECYVDKLPKKKCKVITTISMFYDLNDPKKFVKDVYEVLSDDGVWVVQMSYTPLMIEQMAFDNICHEHACYYTLTSFKKLVEKEKFKILDCSLNDCNGGSFRVYLAKNTFNEEIFMNKQRRIISKMKIDSLLSMESDKGYDTKFPYIDFYNKIVNLKNDVRKFIDEEIKNGKKIIGYGASTKGNTLLHWFGITNKEVPYVSEKSVYKLGLYTASNNIEIISDEKMREMKPDYLLILPWHFVDNFISREKEFLLNGGKMIIPCPEFKIITKEDL